MTQEQAVVEYWENKFKQQQAEIEKLKVDKDRVIRDLIGASLYEHDYKALINKELTDEEINQAIIKSGFAFEDCIFGEDVFIDGVAIGKKLKALVKIVENKVLQK